MTLLDELLRRPPPPPTPRSPRWNRMRRIWLRHSPKCAACGGRLFHQVHHVVPFHIDPARELDVTNLITLCMRPSRSCHLKIGHNGNWQSWNPNVRADAERKRSETIA